MNSTSVCLCMIVKNEAPVIERCLTSVLPIIDHWVICDTGSEDGTQEIIQAFFRANGIPGTLYQRPWKDFAFNRSEALQLARPCADYSLIIDADDTIDVPPSFSLGKLTDDAYFFEIIDTNITYQRMQLVKNSAEWAYKGVLHEFLESKAAKTSGNLPIIMRRNHDGARRRNPNTYVRDAKILESALEIEQDAFLRARYTFYLAQSYRDAGVPEKALEHYLKRSTLGFWQDEVFVSLHQAGKIMEGLKYDVREILDAYARASESAPWRSEALHASSRLCRERGLSEEGYAAAKKGLQISRPAGGLFVEDWIYEYGLKDELAVHAYWTGRYKECLQACLELLTAKNVPPHDKERISANAKAAADRATIIEAIGSGVSRDLLSQHPVEAEYPVEGLGSDVPRVLIAILAKQKEYVIRQYLECIDKIDYPKKRITLYIRTNNNSDNTKEILSEWINCKRELYEDVYYDDTDVEKKIERFRAHEWNSERFSVLAKIRNESIKYAKSRGVEFYFVCDVDNLIVPYTLKRLVKLNLPVVAPLLRSLVPGAYYSNYHAAVDESGYYRNSDDYMLILERKMRGIISVPLVHCTYLIRSDCLDRINYEDRSGRYEYVIFSDLCRKNHIDQFIDNRSVYGYILFDEGDLRVEEGPEKAMRLLSAAFQTA